MGAEPASDAACRTPGRRWTVEREREVLRAALELLVEDGFGGMSIEGVAARTGSSKATLYRRWRDKAELVADAIRSHRSQQFEPTDSGDLRTDLTSYLRHLDEVFSGPDGAVITALVAERLRHPDLAEVFERRFVAQKRREVHAMFQRAVRRGELPPDTDVEVLADLGPALMLYRSTLWRQDRPADLADRIVRQLLG